MIVAAIQGRLQKFQKKHISEVNDYEDQYPSDDDIMVQIFLPRVTPFEIVEREISFFAFINILKNKP